MGLSTNTMYLVAMLLIAGAAGLAYLILRRRPGGVPQGVLEWTGATFALLALLAAVGMSVLAFTRSSGSTKAPPVVGREAPPLSFRMVASNEKRALSDYRGKVVLLNLWATWCPPCLDELPQLNRFQETYGPQGGVVVTISDERRATIQRFEKEQLKLKTVSGYLPQERSWPAPYSRVLSSRPFSFVIGPEGTIKNMWAGARDYAFFQRAVLPLLPEEPEEPPPPRAPSSSEPPSLDENTGSS